MNQPNTIPAWVDPTLFPFAHRFIAVDDCRLHYVDEGRGPVLLLLHGNPTWAFLYRQIMLGLRDQFRCIALDYPGFGLSTARAGYGYTPAEQSLIVEHFIEQLDLQAITLMVQDWGGPIGLGVAGRRPERFAGLVIGNTWAWPVSSDPHFRRFSNLMGGPIGRFAIRNFNAFVNLLIPAGIKRKKLTKAEMTMYRQPFPSRQSRYPTYVFPHEIVASHAYLAQVEAKLAQLQALPILLVWGDADFAFRDAERQRFETLFPHHKTVILKGAGHFVQEDAPEEIVAAIQAWHVAATPQA